MGRARTRWRWIERAGTDLNLNIKHLSMLIHRRRLRKQMIIEILNLNLGFNLVALTPPTPTILLQKGSGAFREKNKRERDHLQVSFCRNSFEDRTKTTINVIVKPQ